MKNHECEKWICEECGMIIEECDCENNNKKIFYDVCGNCAEALE